jgi:hypothetical protein
MVQIDLLVFELEFGLHMLGDNPSLTFIFFMALSLLSILGVRFAYYAHLNMRQTEIDMQIPIWLYLRYIGTLAALYGIIGLLEIVSNLTFVWKNGLLLGMTLLLAFALRQIHFTSSAGGNILPEQIERMTRAVFIAAVFVYITVIAITGQTAWTAALEGISALGFVLYGVAYFYDQTSSARLQGTMLDSLLRHLLPVLVFASMVGIVAFAITLGSDPIVALHIQVVFIIMTAGALMTGTIKLRQNLAGL